VDPPARLIAADHVQSILFISLRAKEMKDRQSWTLPVYERCALSHCHPSPESKNKERHGGERKEEKSEKKAEGENRRATD